MSTLVSLPRVLRAKEPTKERRLGEEREKGRKGEEGGRGGGRKEPKTRAGVGTNKGLLLFFH